MHIFKNLILGIIQPLNCRSNKFTPRCIVNSGGIKITGPVALGIRL